MSVASTSWKWTKRILKWVFITLFILIVAAIAIPYFFKDQILAKVKEEANKRLNATVDFGNVDLSLVWTFPSFSLGVENITVTGQKEFDGLKLVDIQKLSLSINFWSVFSGDYEINGFEMEKPNFYVKVLNNGKANYDIMKPDTAAVSPTDTTPISAEPSSFRLALRYYAINGANITYDDAPAKTFVEIKNLTHTGSGDFTDTRYDLYTKTTMDAFTVAQAGVKYLNKTKVAIDFIADIDASKGMSIKLRDNSFKFNDLGLLLEGAIDMPNDKDIYLDLVFKTLDTKFSSVLSMIPAAYTKDFADVKTSGSFNLAGNVKGTYNDKQMPAFALNLEIDNAKFQYPSLPMAVTDINTKIKLVSPSADLDKMTIDVDKFHFQLGANPFDMMFKLRTPMSDPDIDAKFSGRIDLADLTKAFPLEGTTLSGLVTTDLEARTKMSYVTTAQYDKVVMRGNLGIAAMNYAAQGSPTTKINSLLMDFTPNNVNISTFDMTMGKSDLQANGKLDNILTYFSGDKIMKGNLNVTSRLLDLNEMTGSSTTTTTTEPSAATNMKDTTVAPSSTEPVFDKFDFAANVQCNKIIYDVYTIDNFKMAGQVSPSVANLTNFEMLINKVDMKASGKLENIFPYLFDGQLLKGNFNLTSNYMNINQFMRADGQATEPTPAPTPPADPSTAPAEYEPILVPNNLDLRFTSTLNTLIYDTYNLKNVKCDIIIRNQKLDIQNLSTNFLGGFVSFKGAYDSKNPEKPTFNFAYKVAKIDFQETGKTIGLVKYFIPILSSLQGKFDSEFQISGFFEKNMYPNLKSINSDGLITTYETAMKGFAPAKALADKLKVKELENMIVKNTKNFFTIKDGRMEMKPFNTQVQGIDMLLSGSHGIDASLKYELLLNIPRALLEKNPVGAAANTGLAALQGEASKLGINLNQGDVVKVAVDILGNFAKPEYKVRLLGTGGKGESLADQAKAKLQAELDKAKAEAEARARAEADKLKAEADKARAEAEARARAEADKFKSEAERAKAEAEAKARAEADRLKAEADKAKNAAQAKADSIKAANEAKAKAEAERLRKEAEQKAKDKLKLPKF